MTEAMKEVIAEREKQIERWGNASDDAQVNEELLSGAAAYLDDNIYHWPEGPVWEPANFKTVEQVGRRGQLIRAAAMIIAEIDRLDRIETTKL